MIVQGVAELPKFPVTMWINPEGSVGKPLIDGLFTTFCYGDEQCLPWLNSHYI
jgi:hypothetical protein